ncbi:MAG: hypothetical protein EGR22_09205 [Ruminococcaceae bacterium]|nr:hypothetical protein [Oscillospiraceae bacterium]
MQFLIWVSLFSAISIWDKFFRTWVEFQALPLKISRGIYLFEYQTKTENSFFKNTKVKNFQKYPDKTPMFVQISERVF